MPVLLHAVLLQMISNKGAVPRYAPLKSMICQVVSSLSAARDSATLKHAEDAAQPDREQEGEPQDVVIQRLAQQAEEEAKLVFYYPAEGIPIRSSGTLYYNAASSSLPGCSFFLGPFWL